MTSAGNIKIYLQDPFYNFLLYEIPAAFVRNVVSTILRFADANNSIALIKTN